MKLSDNVLKNYVSYPHQSAITNWQPPAQLVVTLASELLLARKVIEAARKYTGSQNTGISACDHIRLLQSLESELLAYDAEFGEEK